jgi:quinol-cytochrome oxidoreductase complex cytochrome b subunit
MAMGELVKEYTREAAKLDQERRAKKKLRPVEGYPFWPHEVVRDAIILCVFTAAMFYLAAFMPYFLETPADPAGQPQVILPDWYLLWTYGALKITDDITILGWQVPLPFIGEDGAFALNPALWGPMNAKIWGILIQGLEMVPVILVPFIDRGHSRRPVESPFWAAGGFAGVIYVLMQSVYSINNVIYAKFPFWGREYGTWTKQYITLFQLDLLSWATNLLPIVAFFAVYVPLKVVQKQHGYEAKLNYSYYKTR